jgi:hypothetical protein
MPLNESEKHIFTHLINYVNSSCLYYNNQKIFYNGKTYYRESNEWKENVDAIGIDINNDEINSLKNKMEFSFTKKITFKPKKILYLMILVPLMMKMLF